MNERQKDDFPSVIFGESAPPVPPVFSVDKKIWFLLIKKKCTWKHRHGNRISLSAMARTA